MKIFLRHLLYILLAFTLCVGYAEPTYAASKARSSQSSKKKSSKSKKTKSSTSKKSNSKSSKSSKSSKNKKNSRTRSKSSSKYPRKRTYQRIVKPAPAPDPVLNDSLTLSIDEALKKWIPTDKNPGGLRVNSVVPDSAKSTVKVSLNENYTYLPVNQEFISSLQREIKRNLPDSLKSYQISISSQHHPMTYYISRIDKLPEKYRKNIPFVVQRQPWVNPIKGMEGDIVGLWSSHGRYYKGGSWQWQRPLLFNTLEDIYTMSYILPFVVPMLENAGAYVMLPRERDLNSEEVIVDNDTNPDGKVYSQPYYREKTGNTQWETGEEEGFIYDLPDFRDTENPFENGTYRQTKTIRSGSPSVAAWYADIPHDGEYAIYVSYKSLPNSTEDALYTVNYSGGSREFNVNQTMGGGTWIYLGTFPLEAGYSDTEPVVTLTNISKTEGKILTADAIKIGGGMGNIARSPNRRDIYYDPSTPENSISINENEEETEEEIAEATQEIDDEGDVDKEQETTSIPATPMKQSLGRAPVFSTSKMPRFVEGARYWLHWAGAPENVYSPYHGTNDYKDDYTGRGHWINWLAGGSRVIPDADGLNIPVDVCMALHSDAGKRSDDSFVGTLGIYFTNGGDRYEDGTPRINSRMLTDYLMRQITGDIRQTFEPRWTRRSMWDKSYVEARVPEVPTALIELMSHQNFADMKYGLDPSFRFWVGRSIYKALGRFMAERKDREFVVQPLPVCDFAIRRTAKNHYRLSWHPTTDPIESTATPKKYIILERTADQLGFHKIGETHATHFDVIVNDNDIHSFRIIAANDGGLSFPSETLALREGTDLKQTPVLIVNGFTRVSGPANFSQNNSAGFKSQEDFGVPYINDISFAGHQTEFNRNAGDRFGVSNGNYTTKVIGGNTFDYPYIHGEAVANAGYGFVSASEGAVARGDVKLHDFKIVDLILGKQKATTVGNGKIGTRFNTLSDRLAQRLNSYLRKGGHLIASGQYIASEVEANYASENFGIELDSICPISASSIDFRLPGLSRYTSFSSTLNRDNYIVEKPDPLLPVGNGNSIVATLPDSDIAVGVLSRHGKSKRAIFSVPLESLTNPTDRNDIFASLLRWLSE